MTDTQKKNYLTLIVTMLALVNSILMSYGYYHLDSKTLQSVDQYVSYILSFIGVIMSHRQPVKYYWSKFLSFFKKG